MRLARLGDRARADAGDDDALGAVLDGRVHEAQVAALVPDEDLDRRQRGDVREVVHALERRLSGRRVVQRLGREEGADESLLGRLERVDRVALGLLAIESLRCEEKRELAGGDAEREEERLERTWQMRSLRTIKVPRLRELGVTAVVTAESKLLPPSAPMAVEGRMAPTTTTGLSH